MSKTATPVFGVTGWKNSGKTRMVANLVSEFRKRGLTVSTIKHAHHSFDVDRQGTDSWQHREAGASEVALVSRNRWVLMHELHDEEEPALADIVQHLSRCDLIIIEGYKREDHPKIEMIRKDRLKDQPLWPEDKTIRLIGSDDDFADCPLPVYSPDNVSGIADYIAEMLGLSGGDSNNG